MAEPTPISGEDLVAECAKRIATKRANEQNIARSQRDIETYTKANVTLQADIDAMTAAIQAGQPYTPPKA